MGATSRAITRLRVHVTAYVFAAAVAASAITAAPAAQRAAPPTARQPSAQQPPPPTFRTGVTLVPVDVRVLDREGKPVTDLKQSDFTVLEDGAPHDIVTSPPRAGADAGFG